jgi:hypothetical protein
MKTMIQCLALAAGLALAGPASAYTFDVYDSADFGNELITSLPGDNNWYALYSVDVGTLTDTTMLVVIADGGQLENSSASTDHYITSHLIRSDTAGGTTGTEIDDANAMNITAQVYRHVPFKPAIVTTTTDTGKHYVNLLVQLATGANPLTVVSGSGHLQVLKITP